MKINKKRLTKNSEIFFEERRCHHYDDVKYYSMKCQEYIDYVVGHLRGDDRIETFNEYKTYIYVLNKDGSEYVDDDGEKSVSRVTLENFYKLDLADQLQKCVEAENELDNHVYIVRIRY